MAKTVDIVRGATKGCECRARRVSGWLPARKTGGSVWLWLSKGLISCLVTRLVPSSKEITLKNCGYVFGFELLFEPPVDLLATTYLFCVPTTVDVI